MVRLQRFLADAGIASRRASEQIILAGRVEVNGQVASQLGAKVDPACDSVRVDGKPIKSRRRLYVALHKPPGWLCTRHDPAQRQVIGDLLPREWSNLYPVGRLDFDSEGLIFLTNDGDFCLKMTHPRFGVRKTYLATVMGRATPDIVGQLVKGVLHRGERLKAESGQVLDANNTRSLVELHLVEGRNREVRRMFEAIGLNVSRLVRVQIGRIQLGSLPMGRWRVLTDTEVGSLLANAGAEKAAPGARPAPRRTARRPASPRRRSMD